MSDLLHHVHLGKVQRPLKFKKTYWYLNTVVEWVLSKTSFREVYRQLWIDQADSCKLRKNLSPTCTAVLQAPLKDGQLTLHSPIALHRRKWKLERVGLLAQGHTAKMNWVVMKETGAYETRKTSRTYLKRLWMTVEMKLSSKAFPMWLHDRDDRWSFIMLTLTTDRLKKKQQQLDNSLCDSWEECYRAAPPLPV